MIASAWSRTAGEVLRELAVSPEIGLSAAEVQRRRARHGRNVLQEVGRASAGRILGDQFKGLVVWLLAAAAALAFQFGEWTEGAAIVVVLLINAAVGFATELKAVRSMEALRRIGRVLAKVRRDGRVAEVPAQDLVPGDLVLLEGGDIVPADLRLVQASNLQCDESLLTGESVPVRKAIDGLPADAPLAERLNIAFKGTAVTRGAGEGAVIATGTATELGQISSLVERAEAAMSPLERRLDQMSRRLVWVTLALAVAVAVIGIVAGRDLLLMIQTGVALAVAAVPEGLPIVATMALARGMWRMARRDALIERLPAVETLGSTTVIFTDKTGTLTENRMTVTRLVLPSGVVEVGAGAGGRGFLRDGARLDPRRDDVSLARALTAAVLCANASLPRDGAGARAVGDPMEVALLVAGAAAGLERGALLAEHPEVREEAFDPDLKMMATMHRDGAGFLLAVKGAPEAVLARASRVAGGDRDRALTDHDRRAWLDANDRLAAEGLRVLALADRRVDRTDADPYVDLVLLGLVGLADPPRADVPEAVRACRRAGIRVVMVTGDHAVTARSIATQVGLVDDREVAVVEGRELPPLAELSDDERERLLRALVFARISPKQKLDLVELYQAAGAVVAMTGDGVNDAPALKKADIGIAMGRRGSQVAREAADIVLRDDAFPSIVAAVEQGRIVFGNIRKFVLYLLSCNLSEVLVVSLAAMSGLPLPLLPLQILFLNLVTDIFPAFALGVGEGRADTMRRPPRNPAEPILTARHWMGVAAWGALITAATLGALLGALGWLGLDAGRAVTVSFLTLAFAQLLHAFNMREPDSAFLRNEITRNPFVWGALALCTALILGAVHIPVLAEVLQLRPLPPEGWALVVAMSFVPWALGQAALGTAARRAQGRARA